MENMPPHRAKAPVKKEKGLHADFKTGLLKFKKPDILHRGFSPLNRNDQKLKGFSH
jgi:hypothetical protein